MLTKHQKERAFNKGVREEYHYRKKKDARKCDREKYQ